MTEFENSVPLVEAPPRRRRRKEARPGEIVAAALSVFAEKGFAATRLDDVAERAGTGKGTIYLYFETKEALFEGVVRTFIEPLIERVDAAARSESATAADLIEVVIDSIYTELVCTERRQIMRMLIAEAGRFPQLVELYYRNSVGRGKVLLQSIVKRGIERGEFRDSAVALHPEVILGPAIMASIWKMIFDEIDPMDLDGFRKAHVEIMLAGLRAG